jgi:hypothetical protein
MDCTMDQTAAMKRMQSFRSLSNDLDRIKELGNAAVVKNLSEWSAFDVFEYKEASAVLKTSAVVKVGDGRMEKVGGNLCFANRLFSSVFVCRNDFDQACPAGSNVTSSIRFGIVAK